MIEVFFRGRGAWFTERKFLGPDDVAPVDLPAYCCNLLEPAPEYYEESGVFALDDCDVIDLEHTKDFDQVKSRVRYLIPAPNSNYCAFTRMFGSDYGRDEPPWIHNHRFYIDRRDVLDIITPNTQEPAPTPEYFSDELKTLLAAADRFWGNADKDEKDNWRRFIHARQGHNRMTTSNRAQIAPQIQPNTQDFDPRDLALSYYYAAIDRQLSDGSTLVNTHISPNFRTLEEAQQFRDNCGIEGARIVVSMFFCRDQEEHDELEHDVFVTCNQRFEVVAA